MDQIKSLLLSHHHSTSALVSEILTSVLQTVQNKNKNKMYIWTVHIYRLYRRQCAKYTYIYSVHTVYYKDILSYQYTLYTVCTRLHYVHYLYIVLCEGAIDYTFTADGCATDSCARCNRLCICSVVDVHCMVSSDSR